MSTKKTLERRKLKTLFEYYQYNKFILLAFAFPFLLMTVAFAIKEVSPFGDKQILVTDLWHQYYPFLVDLQSKLKHGESLFYTWSVGMGTNYLSLMSYYLASPINFLSVFVPSNWLREFLMFSVVLKMALASCFFAIFLRYAYKKNDISIVFFSVLFGLCSFYMGYYWNTIWLDTVSLTPLVAMGIYAVLREGKFKLYIISLAVAIMANYYIGLFLCYFSFLLFIIYVVSDWSGIKSLGKNLIKMGIYSLVSLCITAIITIPAYMGLQKSYSNSGRWDTTFRINQFLPDTAPTHDLVGVFKAFGQILTNTLAFIAPNPKDVNRLPNIYCGIIAIMLAILFLSSAKIKLKEKIVNCAVLSFLVLSMIMRHLEFIWNGFHFTNMIPYRFSFLFSFILITMAFRAYHVLNRKSLWDILIAVLFMGIILVLSIDVQQPNVIWGSAIIVALIAFAVICYTNKWIPKKLLSFILCILVFCEMGFNAIIGVNTVTVTGTYDYPRGGENTAKVLSEMNRMERNTKDLWRAEMTTTQTINDGALNQYNGVTVFSSMTNVSMTYFAQDFGLSSWPSGNRYAYFESSPVTNLFLNIKYLISRNGKYANDMYLNEVASSESVKLLKNTAYLPMGFMVNKDLKRYEVETTERNPFEVQNEFVKLATGETRDVYERLEVVNQGHTAYEDFPVNKTDYGKYTFETKSAGIEPQLKYNYEAPKDGLYMAYVKFSDGYEHLTVKRNEEDVDSYTSIGRPYLMCIGSFKKGDKISLYSKLKKDASGSVTVYCDYFNEEVFNDVYKKLSENTFEAKEVKTTKIKGTIDVKNDGLFYTSINYEKGWTVLVDGKIVNVTPIGNALLAFDLDKGPHDIEISYIPDGFILGAFLTLFGITMLILLSIFQKYRKPNMYVMKRLKDTDKAADTKENEGTLNAQEDKLARDEKDSDTGTKAPPFYEMPARGLDGAARGQNDSEGLTGEAEDNSAVDQGEESDN